MKDRKMKYPLSGTDKGRIERCLDRAARHDLAARRDALKQVSHSRLVEEVRHAS